MSPPGQYLPNMLLERHGVITPERMKRWSPNENNTQLCSGWGLCSLEGEWGAGPRAGQTLYLPYSCLENSMNSMKRQKDMALKDELTRLAVAQYATGEEWRNNFRKNEEAEPKLNQCPVVGVTGNGSKT